MPDSCFLQKMERLVCFAVSSRPGFGLILTYNFNDEAMKAIIYLASLITILSSCSGNKFLNRKYTSGRFSEQKRTLKHNTIFADTTASYSSLSDKIELKKAAEILENYSEKEIILSRMETVSKKDSVFIKTKKGKDKKTVKKNDLDYDVITVIDKNGAIVSQKNQPHATLDPETKNDKDFNDIKSLSKIALAFCWVPVLGLIYALRLKKRLRKYKAAHPTEDLHKYSVRTTVAVTISTIISSFVIGFIIGFLIIFAFVLLLITF